MEKITLKLGDVLQLESEINGYIEPQTGEQVFEGFSKQNLSIILKYEYHHAAKTHQRSKSTDA